MVEEDKVKREENERLVEWDLGWCGVNADVVTAAAAIRRVANFIVRCFVRGSYKKKYYS